MEKGTNSNTRYVLNYIGPEKIEEINAYIAKVLSENIKSFANSNEIEESFNEFLTAFYERISEEERGNIQSYTGLSFRKVNSYLRGVWDYEKNGKLTEDIKNEASELASSLRKALLKAPVLPFNILVYRGVGPEAFYSYGITNLKDLIYLKDRFMYEDGFTSTSLLRSNSFYENKPVWVSVCNIEIECLVPNGTEDGLLLLGSNINYLESQLEFLINSSSLFKVIDVEINKEQNTAKIKTILIPQKLWNPLDYEMARKTNRHI